MDTNIERDELARDIFLSDNSNGAEAQMLEDWEAICLLGGGYTYAHNTADGLIAKGYRKPCTITAVEELNKFLPDTVFRAAGGRLYTQATDQRRLDLADEGWYTHADVIARERELTVIWEPETMAAP